MQGHPRKIIENPLPVPELLARAGQGEPDCQYWAAIRYFQADGVPEDPRRAVDLCVRAAQQGHVRALAFLAYCYSKGIVLPKNSRAAARCYRTAAAEGYAPAQFTLGTFYLKGRGVKKNVRLGLMWLEKAADEGMTDALLRLGTLHKEGQEVVQDEERACSYFRRAAELGDAEGQFQYGGMLMAGRGVAKDPVQALEMLDRSCEQGYPEALEILKHMNEFVGFDASEVGFGDFPVKHVFPVRRRTAIYVAALGKPCFQSLAGDLYDYLRDNPKDEEAGLKDIAALLHAAADKGDVFLPMFK